MSCFPETCKDFNQQFPEIAKAYQQALHCWRTRLGCFIVAETEEKEIKIKVYPDRNLVFSMESCSTPDNLAIINSGAAGLFTDSR